jgi:hypothetical protein
MCPVTNDHDTDGRKGPGFVKTEIQADSDTAEFDFLEIIAGLEEKEIDELPQLYTEL